MIDTATSRANEIRIEHPQLWDLFSNNASVHAWLKMWFTERCTLEEALIGALLELGKQNQKYFDEIVEIKFKQEYPNEITKKN